MNNKRMNYKSSFILALVLSLIGLPGYAQDNARTYQECLLNATSEGIISSRRDIGLVKEMCEQRFPETAPGISGEKVEDEVLANIDIWTHRGEDNSIKGSIYNGNSDLVITQVTLLLTPSKSGDAVQDFFDSEEYEINRKILPFKTKTFYIPADDTEITGDFHWNLIRARGY